MDMDYRFDDPESRIGDAKLWEQWFETAQKTNKEISSLEMCVADESTCERDMHRIRTLVIKGADLQPSQQLQLVNRFVNRMRRYKDDKRTIKQLEEGRLAVPQQWTTLMDFVRKGGDCEDFATAKYALLKLLGFDSNDLRIVVVYERGIREHHAIIAVRVDDDEVALLDLDNRIYSQTPHHYRLVYSINEDSIWDHSLDKTILPRTLRKRQAAKSKE